MTNVKSPSSSNTLYAIKKSPNWLRVAQVGLGTISIILSIVVLTFTSVGIYSIIVLLSIALLMVGIERIAIGIAVTLVSKPSRVANIALGALAIVFASIVMSFPLNAAVFLIFLGAYALLFNGIARIAQGAVNKNISGWYRGFLIGVGVLSIAVSGLVIAHPISLGVPLLAAIISIATLITGIEMITVGLVGGRSLLQYNSQSQHDNDDMRQHFMTAGRQILFGHIAAETPHDSTNNKKPTVIQTDDLVKMAEAQILPQNAIQSSFKQIHFLICETCFWCASLLYEMADHTTFLNCHICIDKKIRSYRLA